MHWRANPACGRKDAVLLGDASFLEPFRDNLEASKRPRRSITPRNRARLSATQHVPGKALKRHVHQPVVEFGQQPDALADGLLPYLLQPPPPLEGRKHEAASRLLR